MGKPLMLFRDENPDKLTFLDIMGCMLAAFMVWFVVLLIFIL